MGFAEKNQNLDRLLTEFVDGASGIKKALVDGRFDVSEIRDVLNSVDPAVGEWVGDMLDALKGLYPEIKALLDGNPFTLMMEAVPYLAGKFMGVFK